MPTKRSSDKRTYHEDLEFTQDRVRDEDRLIGDRFSWLLNSQTIFLASYAVLFQLNQQNGIIQGQESFFRFVPVIALGTCAINYISILGAILSIYKYCKKLNKDHKEHLTESRWKILGSTLTHIMGQSSPFFIPLGFLGVWIFILFGFLTSIISISISLALLIFLWVLNFPRTKIVGDKV
jgi:hypothetical protein